MEITPQCYAHFTRSLMGLASGRVAVVLEVCMYLFISPHQIPIIGCYQFQGGLLFEILG